MSKFDKVYRKIIRESFPDEYDKLGSGISADKYERGELPVNVVSAEDAMRKGVSEEDANWLHDNRFAIDLNEANGFGETVVVFKKTIQYDYRFQERTMAEVSFDKKTNSWKAKISKGSGFMGVSENAGDAQTAYETARKDALEHYTM